MNGDCGRQVAGEEKTRHTHYDTGSLDVVIAALVVRPNVVCDCTTADFFLSLPNDMVEYNFLDDPAQAPSLTRPSLIYEFLEVPSHQLSDAQIPLKDVKEDERIST